MKRKHTETADRMVYEFPYFNGKIKFYPIYIARVLLACILCGSGCVLFSKYLLMPNDTFQLFFISAGICLLFYILFTYFRKLYVSLGTISVFAIFLIHNRDILGEYWVCLWHRLEEVVSGENVYGIGYVFDSSADDEKCIIIMLFIAAFFAFITAISCAVKFRPDSIIVTVAIFILPAFIGEMAYFDYSMGILIASFAGLFAINTGYDSSLLLLSRNSKSASHEQYKREWTYLKENRKLFGTKKLRSTIAHFGSYTSNAVAVFLVAAIVICSVATFLPKDFIINVNKIGEAISEITNNPGLFHREIQSGGYFSADTEDSFINITNSINADYYNNGNDEALRVSLSDDSAPIFLRADIGYEYEDEKWTSISSIDYESLYYSGVSFDQILDTYSTDLEYQIFRRRAVASGIEGDKFFPLVNVKIDYTKKTNAVFIPLSPYELTFRNNDDFNCVGDFVASVKNSFSRIGQYEALTISPTIRMDDAEEIYRILYESSLGDDASYCEAIGYDYESYLLGKLVYSDFISDTYTEVPEGEKSNIDRLMNRMNVAVYFDGAKSCEDEFRMLYPSCDESIYREFYNFVLTNLLTGYFSSGIEYTYSLTAPNSMGSNTYLGNFLFETKQGHCALYATALTLLLRNAGIPARYVTGYVVDGVSDGYGEDGYIYSVKEKQLHAWVEVYFEDIGWLPFDPTPAVAAGGLAIPEETTTIPETEATTTTEETTEEVTSPPEETTVPPETTVVITTSDINSEADENSINWKEVIFSLLTFLIPLLIIFIIISGFKRFLRELDKRECILRKRFSDEENVAACSLMLKFVLKLFRLRGITRRTGESPMEFAERVEKRIAINSITFANAMEIFERAEFDSEVNVEITDAEHHLCENFVTRHLTKYLNTRDNPLKRLRARYRLFWRNP